MAKFKAKICERCRGVGMLHKIGDPDKLCQFCSFYASKPSVVRKWLPGKSCVIDKGTMMEIKGVLAKAPFLNQFREWCVIVVTVGEAMSRVDHEYYLTQFNVRILMKRVSLS